MKRNRIERLGLVTIVALMCVFCQVTVAIAMDEAKMLETYGKAVVLIASYHESDSSISQGSGFIVDSSGVIVSNYHVIARAYPMIVQLTGGDRFTDVMVVDFDSIRDIAVLKVNGWKLPTVRFADSDSAKVGQKIIVIGNPQGLSNTVSNGLLSGIRDFGEGFKWYQISAPISPGSSGSPIFDEEGRVIGIATASIRTGQNLNFAIPINYARPMISAVPKMSLKEFAEKINNRNDEDASAVAGPPLFGLECLGTINDILEVFFRKFDVLVAAYQDFKEDNILSGLLLSKEHFASLQQGIKEIVCAESDLAKFRFVLQQSIEKTLEAITAIQECVDGRNQTGIAEGKAKFAFALEHVWENRGKFNELVKKYDLDSTLEILPVMHSSGVAFGLSRFGVQLSLGVKHGVVVVAVDQTKRSKYYLSNGDKLVGGKDTRIKFGDLCDLEKYLDSAKPGATSIPLLIERDGKQKLSAIILLEN